MKITLNQIRNNYKKEKPCEESWLKLLNSLKKTKADDEPISFEYLLETLGINDTLWIIDNCVQDEFKIRNMCADFAESVLHNWENWAKDNAPEHFSAPRKAIDVCRNLNATKEERDSCYSAAKSAAKSAADYTESALKSAMYAESTAELAAWSTWSASWIVNWSDSAARSAEAKEREKQKLIILKYFKNENV